MMGRREMVPGSSTPRSISMGGCWGLCTSMPPTMSCTWSFIHICTIMPATIDTPFFRHAANYSGRAVKALPPVYTAEMVAQTMLQCAVKPQREVFVGNAGRMIGSLHSIAPTLVEPMMARQIEVGHLKDEPGPSTSGNLFEPMTAGDAVSDGWQ